MKMKVYTGNQQHLIIQEFQNLAQIMSMLFPADKPPEGRLVKTEADLMQMMKIFEH